VTLYGPLWTYSLNEAMANAKLICLMTAMGEKVFKLFLDKSLVGGIRAGDQKQVEGFIRDLKKKIK